MNADDIAKQVFVPLIGGAQDIEDLAEALVLAAWRQGFVLTIETKAEAPLAMGHYGVQVDVRPRRDVLAVDRHELYKTGDADAPSQLLDRNGEVVLAQCRRCGCGEIELSQPCLPQEVAQKNLEANDARVGRRFNSYGRGGR